MTKGRAILLTLRPKQWVKNLFVLAALVFSKHLPDTGYLLPALAAFFVFCGLSGAVYAFNDVLDAESDRRHPVKRHRPIASGALGRTEALVVAGVLALGALVGALAIDVRLFVVATAYVTNNLAYTLYLKRIAFLDVLLISFGFLLRVVAGAYAIDVPVSPWLLVCTALLASLLGFGKRASELTQLQVQEHDVGETRVSLQGYHIGTLRFCLLLLSIGTCAAYALYTRDPRTVAFFQTKQLLWTLPYCVAGIARFLQLALWRQSSESPTDAILRDWPFLGNLVAWGATVLYVIYA